MTSSSDSGTAPRPADPVANLVEAFASRQLAGEAIDPEEFLSQHPAHAERLRALLPMVAMLAAVQPAVPQGTREPNEWADTDHDGGPGVFGDFRVVREIGRGGMGIVYEAEQLSLRRRVALKVLRFGATLDSRQRERFYLEARAAAQLHHDNIVPVFTVGCEHGVSFYAMQLIEGRTLASLIAEWSSGTGGPEVASLPPAALFHSARSPEPAADTAVIPLPPGSREFFRQVARMGIQAAQALDYAHRGGIIHRDVKPANLLVDPAGRLWVTDFGLALFQEASGLTQTGDLVGTPRYMSPEQVRGQRGVIDHRTDVYSLGATLYEMLTLRAAFRSKDRQALLREIADTDPPAPRRWNPAVPIDLETIVLKAMSKEPEARYATARELMEDLQRFLDGQSVLARRPTPSQRAIRWLRRHPAAVGVAVVGLVVFAVGSAVFSLRIYSEKEQTRQAYDLLHDEQERTRQASEEAVRGRRRLQQTLQETLSEVIDDWLTRHPELTPEQRAFLERTVAAYQNVAGQVGSDPEVRAGLALSCFSTGLIRSQLGQLADAVAAYERGRQLLRQLVDEYPDKPVYRRTLAVGCNHLGNLLRSTGRRKEAVGPYQEAVEQFRALVRDSPGAPRSRAGLADSFANLGTILQETGRFTEGDGAFAQALTTCRDLVRDHPEVSDYRARLAFILRNRAVHWRAAGRGAEAEAPLREAISLLRKLSQDSPAVLPYRIDLAASLDVRGVLLREARRYGEAEPSLREALALRQQAAQVFPGVAAHRRDASVSLNNLGNLLQEMGRLREAEAAYREALAIRQGLVRESPADGERLAERAAVYTNLGILLGGLGKSREAEAAYRAAVSDLEKSPGEVRNREARSNAQRGLGSLLVGAGRAPEAEEPFRKALALDRGLSEEHPASPERRMGWAASASDLGNALIVAGKLGAAEASLQESLSLWEKVAAQCPQSARPLLGMARAHKLKALVLFRRGQGKPARETAERAVALAERALRVGTDQAECREELRFQHLLLADILLQQGQHARAAEVGVRLAGLSADPLQACLDSHAVLTRCVPLAAGDHALPEDRRQEAARAYGQKTRDLLRQGARRCPDPAGGHNTLAWFLANSLDPVLRDPPLAVELAREATRRAPERAACWNTLGAAHYRAGDWKAARAALDRSVEIARGADGSDGFFLAMTAWQQGDKGQAREWYERAVRWADEHAPGDKDLRRFRAEAAALLGIPPKDADTNR
jgi:serine/threonine protein kinase/Tfp pilus assembly protein PilF